MVICDKCYELDLSSQTFRVNTIKGHTSPCSEKEVLGKEEATQKIIDLLVKSGYGALESP